MDDQLKLQITKEIGSAVVDALSRDPGMQQDKLNAIAEKTAKAMASGIAAMVTSGGLPDCECLTDRA